jgi:putative transposase
VLFLWLGKSAESDEGVAIHGRAEAFIIRQDDDGTPVAEIYRKAGISHATYFNRKKKYAGLMQ